MPRTLWQSRLPDGCMVVFLVLPAEDSEFLTSKVLTPLRKPSQSQSPMRLSYVREHPVCRCAALAQVRTGLREDEGARTRASTS